MVVRFASYAITSLKMVDFDQAESSIFTRFSARTVRTAFYVIQFCSWSLVEIMKRYIFGICMCYVFPYDQHYFRLWLFLLFIFLPHQIHTYKILQKQRYNNEAVKQTTNTLTHARERTGAHRYCNLVSFKFNWE